MKIFKLLTVSILFSLLISGCLSSSKEPYSGEPGRLEQYIAKGESLEKQALFSSALEQYKLALTVDPESKEAIQHKKNVLGKLWKRAQFHYKKGLVFDEQGKYEAARKEYLSALQNWPYYREAKDKLTPGGVAGDTKEYITHTLKYGESVSQLAKIYYGDFKKHTIIGKFNILKDVTKVRVGEKLKIPIIKGISLADLKLKQKNYLSSKKVEPLAAKKEKPAEKPAPEIVETDIEPELVQPTSSAEPEPEKESIPESTPMEPPQVTEEEPPSSESKISGNFEKGIELFNKKDYTKATPLFTAALEKEPDNESLRDYLFKSHFQQGLSLFNAKKYLLAKDNFESALTYNKNCDKCPDYIEKSEETYKDKHYNLGIHYFGKEQLAKAIEEWKRVKKIDPDYKDVTPNLKKAEMLSKRLESIKKGSSE